MLILDKRRAIDRIVALTAHATMEDAVHVARGGARVAAYEPREPAVVAALQRRPSRRRARRTASVASLLY